MRAVEERETKVSARDLMSAPLITCEPETELGEIAVLLHKHRIHGIVVLDDAGAPTGVVSDTDLLAGEWLATDAVSFEVMRRVTAGELMASPLISIDAASDVEMVVAAMQHERVARLIVSEAGGPIGIVSVSDLVEKLGAPPTERSSVRDVMSHGLVVCRETTSIENAARAMSVRHSRSVFVVDAYGKSLGVVTGSDLIGVLTGEMSACSPLRDLAHKPITITPDATLRAAADLMLKHEVHRLIVVNSDESEGLPLGLIATSDIVAEMAAAGSSWRE